MEFIGSRIARIFSGLHSMEPWLAPSDGGVATQVWPFDIGYDFLDVCMLWFLRKVPRASILKLTALLIANAGISIGTGCSGLETPMFAAEALVTALAGIGFCVPCFRHAFAVEIVEAKALFIKRIAKIPIVFRDIVQMGAASGDTWCT